MTASSAQTLRRISVIALVIAVATIGTQLHYLRMRQASDTANLGMARHGRSVTPAIVTPTTAPTPAVAPTITPDFTLPPVTNGLVPTLNRISTTQKVVFLGIDDGVTRSVEAQLLLKQTHIPAALFLNDDNVEPDIGYFQSLIDAGSTIENHTLDHPDMTKLSYAAQRQEICGNADRFGKLFTRRPTIFRPPFGSYNLTTRRAAADCGMRVLINWSAKANGGSMQYQDGHTGLVPGDIVLMHFRPEFASDFKAFQDAANAAGLQTASLEDWLK